MTFNVSNIHMSFDILLSPGKVVEVFSEDDSKAIIQKWLGIFARKRKGCRIKDFKWHVFSGGFFESLQGEDAVALYMQHISGRYIIIDNAETCVFTTNKRPDKVGLSDYYVCPLNMAWTMAFTHEDGLLGPYFAKHPNYTDLEVENERYREKLKQIEEAKRNGWC